MTSLAVLNNIASEEELGSGWKEISELMDSVEQTLNQYATAASVKAIQVNLLKDRNKELSELLDKANEQANVLHAEQLRMKTEIEKQTKEIMSLAFIRSRMDELLENEQTTRKQIQTYAERVAELESQIRAADSAHAQSVAELHAKVESHEHRAKKSEANNEYLVKVLETETNAKKEAETKIPELRADLRTKQEVFDAEIAKIKSTYENQILQLGSERMGGGQTNLLRAKIVSLQDELAELKKGISDKKTEVTTNADDYKSMMPPYPSRFSDDANVGSKRRYEPVPAIKVSAGQVIQKGRKMSAWD